MPKVLKSLARLLDEVPFAPVIATMFGLAAGILVLATPGWLFARAVLASGLPTTVAAGQPLREGAQMIAAVLAAFGTMGILWLLLGSIEALHKPRAPQSRGHRIEPVYEAEPVAPVRRPLFANTELGTPFLPNEAFAGARDELLLDVTAPDEGPALPGEVARRHEANGSSHLLH